MRIRTLFLPLTCVVVCFFPASQLRAQDTATPDARALLCSAHEVSGPALALPYELHGVVVINPGPGEVKGQLAIYRDKDRWRADLQVGQYRESRVVLGNKLYIARSTSFPAPGLGRLTETDRAWDRLPEDGDAELGSVSHKKIQNAQADCFEVKGEQRHRLCFDASRKVLLENLDEQRAIEFSDYQPLGGGQQFYPRKVTVLAELEKSEKPISIVQDIDAHKAQFADAVFAVPDQPLELETCENMRPARLLEKPRPEFARSVRQRNAEGKGVYAYGIAGKDGNLQNIKVLSPDPEVQQSVVEALKKWRYAPAMCGSTPVATEQEIQIPFSRPGGRGER